MADLRRAIADLPDDALIPVRWVRELLGDAGGERTADLTVEDVAKELGRAASTIRGWCGAGDLQHYRLRGREIRVTRAALEAFLDRERNGHQGSERTPPSSDLGAWRIELDGGAM